MIHSLKSIKNLLMTSVLIILSSACTTNNRQWNNVIHDTKTMRVAWAKGVSPAPLSGNEKRYGKYQSVALYMHNYYSTLVDLDQQAANILHDQHEWISRSILVDNEKNRNIQLKAEQMSTIYSKYLNITIPIIQGSMLNNIDLDPRFKDQYLRELDDLNSENIGKIINHMRLGADYFKKISLLLQFVRGKIIVEEKIKFKNNDDFKKYTSFILEIEALAKRIDALELELAPRREKIITDFKES